MGEEAKENNSMLNTNSELPIEPYETTWNWFPNLWWNRPPPEILQDIEETIIQRCKTPSKGWYVDIPAEVFQDKQKCYHRKPGPCRIWTRKFEKVNIRESRSNGHVEKTNDDHPLVMVHGLGAGGALFALNVDGLASCFSVYCIDLPGFARSSRIKLSSDTIRCEEQLLSLLEAWRQEVGLNRINLLGHSFGGYLCASYAVKYPERINHLLLADPWGFTALPPEIENGQYVSPSGRTIPWWFFILFKIYNFFNPLALFRVGGRYTLSLIKNRRRDICEPFNILWEKEEDNVSADYLHQANLHTPSGESAFCTLAKYFFWSKLPFISRINELDSNIPLTAIYGGNSWMPSLTREEFEHARNGEGYSRSRMIEDVGHHVYSKFTEFNSYVIRACKVSNPAVAPASVQ